MPGGQQEVDVEQWAAVADEIFRVEEGAAERRSSTHYLLLLAVGREALGQQGTVLQQDFGDGLGGGENRQLLEP